MQNKFLTEILNNINPPPKPQVLYGWGGNNSGQLALPSCNVVSHPTRIPLPELSPDDEIDKIECGWKFSCFLTKKHQLYLSESIEKKPHNILEEEKHKKNKKDDKKIAEKTLEKIRWINITSSFEQLKYLFIYFSFDFFFILFKNHIILYFCSC